MNLLTRLRAMMAVLFVAYSILAAQLFYLTVVKGSHYRTIAESRRIGKEHLPALRAPILDRFGRPLAMDEPGFDLHVRIAELEGEGSIRRTARQLGLGRVALGNAVAALEERVDAMTRGLDSTAVATVRTRPYPLSEVVIEPDDGDLLEFAVSACDHSGFTVERDPGGGYSLHVCLAELRGEAALRRVESLTGGEITVAELEARLANKRIQIGKRVQKMVGDRASSPRRVRKVTSDVRGWSFPLVFDVGDALAREAALHPERLVGFELEPMAARRYPAGPVAPHVLGLVNRLEQFDKEKRDRLREREPYLMRDFVGVLGLERAFEDRLHGTPGKHVVERTRRGRGKKTSHTERPKDGEPLWLTIDLDLQLAAEAALDRVSRPGAVVVLDPHTGEVLCMASAPRYDPGEYRKEIKALIKEKPSVFQNRALQAVGQMPPGSVFKLVTALAGLEDGTIHPASTVYDCRPGNRPDCPNHPATPGPIGLQAAIAKSCNVFFGGAAVASGRNLDDWTRRLGFGQSTGIELSETTFSYHVQRATAQSRSMRGVRKQMGIGQILEASPMQIARMTCVFANGGYLVDCHLDLESEEASRRSVGADPRNLAIVQRGMERAVDAGTATASGVGEFGAAGKTGSSQAGSDPDSGSSQTHAWFTGYAPRHAPEIVVTVFVDHIGHGGEYAAPVARDVLEAWDRLKRERGQ